MFIFEATSTGPRHGTLSPFSKVKKVFEAPTGDWLLGTVKQNKFTICYLSKNYFVVSNARYTYRLSQKKLLHI